jgi:hypothetical protein
MADIKAKGAKSIPKKKLGNFSSTSSASTLTEESRTTLERAMNAGIGFGKVFITKPRTDEKGVIIDGTGGKPGVWLELPEGMQSQFEIEGDSLTVFFHNSAKEILAETNNRLSKRMDLVEVFNEETEEYSFLITATGATLDSKTLTLAD